MCPETRVHVQLFGKSDKVKFPMSFIAGSFLERDTRGSYWLSSMASMDFKKSARVSLLFFVRVFF